MNLDIVIVTYNRLDKLKITLQHYQDQTKSFRNLIIVDNCSNDGTAEYLQEWMSMIKNPRFAPVLIKTNENLGGSGGFYLGQKKAMELGADWVMVADDDAYAEPDMVETFYRYHESHDCSCLSAICAAVLHTDGSIALQHRDTWYLKDGKYYTRETSKKEDYEKDDFAIDLFSYVGTFLNAKAMEEYGLVNPDYFIYSDDSEHSFRMKKFGAIIVVPCIKIVHDDGARSDQLNEEIMVSWRDYYIKRNEFHMLLKHMPHVAYRYLWWHVRDWILRRTERTPLSIIDNHSKWDAVLGRMGKHHKYKPGWQLLKQ